jgi:O-antigen/teichoic acid export membrane protein
MLNIILHNGGLKVLMGNNRRLGAFLSYVYMVVNVVVLLIYVPVLLNTIGKEEYGIYQLIGSVMAYVISINGVLSAGVGRYYCKFLAEGQFDKAENTLAISRRLYGILSIIALVLVGVLTVFFRKAYSGLFSDTQINECTAMLFILGINTVVTMSNSISIAAITAYERFAFLKLSSLVVVVVQPFLVIILTTIYPRALTVALVVLAMNLACSFAQGLYRKFVLKVGRNYYGWDSKLAKSLLGFGGAIMMVTIADQIFWKTDQLIVGYLFGASSVAVYAIGAQIYQVYMNLGSAAGAVFLPRVSELYHKNHDLKGISDLFIRFGRLNCILLLYILGAFALFGQEFIQLWVGDGFFDSYLVALIVMVPFTIDLIQNLGLTILQVTNQYYFRGFIYLFIAIVNIFLTFALLSIFGLPGAAISTAVSMFLGNGLIMNWYYSRKVGLDVSRFWMEICYIVFPALLATGLTLLIYLSIPFQWGRLCHFLIGCAVYSFLYLVFEWRFGFNSYEKNLINKVLKMH